MPKFKLKDGVKAESRVAYRTKVGGAMTKVVLKDATQKQLADLHSIKHPFVEEVKASGK